MRQIGKTNSAVEDGSQRSTTPNVPFRVVREGDLPLHLQVKRNMSSLISQGYWGKGEKLPTERELAIALGVSRNTVSLAYRQLETEGLITSRQGRGTFVSDADHVLTAEDRSDQLVQIVDASIDDALLLGFSLDEFASVVEQEVATRRQLFREVRIAFIECNREQLDYFAREIEIGTGVRVMPVMIDALDSEQEYGKVLDADLIVTTFFHLDEVRKKLPERQDDVLGIALDPVIESMVRIARLPQGTKVLLVCISQAFAERVLKSMELAGITELDVQICTQKDTVSLRESLHGKGAVIVSPGRLKEVTPLVEAGTQVIEFIYKPDAGSMNLLRSSVLEHRKKRNNN
ncbi:MAG: GntR family transcriptional regulator [Firmicutes bacterium]|nr:GntR family transcriptional regulator [Candidatus Fermentithermobacillaceae bacterium]HON87399.1 GntR family transcriptional regulator [Bacillota bacterium]HRC53069.1 GntR family transcriptional regulator [Bacillota bacterium]